MLLPVFSSPEKEPVGSCISSSCSKFNKWVSLTYGLGTFQTLAFVLGLRASGPFKSSFSVSLQFCDSPGLSPYGFSKPDILGAHLTVAGSKVWGAWCKAQSLYSSRESSIIFFVSLLGTGHHTWGEVPGETVSLPLLPSRDVSFIFCSGSIVCLSQVVFRGNLLRV